MKNIKVNEELRTRIISGGLSLVLVASGFGLGKLDSKNNSSSNDTAIVSEDELVSQYLDEYVAKRDSLEKEIASLQAQKEKLQNVETFDMDELIVIENINENNEPNLYILREPVAETCYEYHHAFKACYRPEQHICDEWCDAYIHFNESQPLINYLTDEEIEKITSNGGKTTTLELDQILNRMRNEYQEKLSQKSHSKSLTNN